MLTFHINLYWPKAYHRPDHLLRIFEYHRKKLFLIPSSSELESRTDFGFTTFVPVTSPPKQTILFLAPFLYRAYLPSYRNHLHRDSNPGDSRGYGLCPEKSSLKQTTSILAPSTFRAAETSLTGTPIQDTFGDLTFLKSLPNFKAWACQVWC
jgi:hypothetical protein